MIFSAAIMVAPRCGGLPLTFPAHPGLVRGRARTWGDDGPRRNSDRYVSNSFPHLNSCTSPAVTSETSGKEFQGGGNIIHGCGKIVQECCHD